MVVFLKRNSLGIDTFSKITRPFPTFQLQSFLKNIKNFLCRQKIVNNRIIPSLQAIRKITIFLINTLLLYIPLLALTHGHNYRQRVKYTRYAWAGGTFLPVVLLCQFFVLAGNRFWFYLLCTYVLRVQYSCGVVLVFWFWREIVFGVTYVLSVQYSCAVVSVFWLWREIVL